MVPPLRLLFAYGDRGVYILPRTKNETHMATVRPAKPSAAALALPHAQEAMESLLLTMRNSLSPQARVAAANSILDRAYGKAAQAIINQPGNAGLLSMSDDALDAELEAQVEMPALPPPALSVDSPRPSPRVVPRDSIVDDPLLAGMEL